MSGDPLGNYIASRREELNLSQNELAKRSGVSQSYINQLESGINQATGRPFSPTSATLGKLAKGLVVAPDVLDRIARGETAQPTPSPPGVSPERYREVMDAILQLPPEGRAEAEAMLMYLKEKYRQK